MTNYGPDEILDLITSFERSPSKLSENHKNFDIRSSTETKLWDTQPHSLSCHNLNSVNPISM